MSSGIDIIESKKGIGHSKDHGEGPSISYGSGMSEIEEEEEEHSRDLFEINTSGLPLATIKEEVTGSLFSFDFRNWRDVVYVGLGKSEETSMDALVWTLSHAVDPASSVVFLIHVSPEIKQIPTLLGMMPLDQANPIQQEIHLAQERGKRREYVQKFVNVCSASKVKVDTILIESNVEAKAILDLIPILNIRKLVVGTSKRNIKSKRVIGTAGKILKGAPEYCEVKLICEGKEVVDLTAESFSSRASSASPNSIPDQDLGQVNDNTASLSCGSCFKPKVIY